MLTLFLPFHNISVMCISRNYPYPPSNGNRNSEGMGGGGVQKEAISEGGGGGGCYRGLFPGGLSDHEIGELLINNSSVEKAVSYLLLPVFQNKYYNSFALIKFYLWLTKCYAFTPPTHLMRQHFGLSKK